jgi:hypothetical protein
MSRCSPPAAPSTTHQILDSFEGVQAAESTVASQLGEITGQVAGRVHRPSRRRPRYRDWLTRTK